MAQSDGARRWARWAAAHRRWRTGVRWLLMAVVSMVVGTVVFFTKLPQWTLGIGVVLVPALDDTVAWYLKRWSADEEASG
ncbi:hypothetical protein [Streptomyces sp. NPDC012466]|uniref:hypothetical protein n=1 Tax=Streptomyces sp. NPDC012466 TaxID=3364835 RepID=UPI0036E34BA4